MTDADTAHKPLCRSVRMRFEGRVQGVGFRMFVEREAIKNRIDGFVRNRRDGGVEAVFKGDPRDVEAMIAAGRVGPRGSVVQFVKVLDEDDVGLRGFAIRATV
jgi:acylphosphatase